MTSLQIKVDGVEELASKLHGLGPELRLELRKMVSAAAAIVRDEAVRLIHSPGGHAAKGIKIRVSGSGAEMHARVMPGGRGGPGRAAIFSQRSRGAGTMPPPMKAARAMARRYGIPMSKARGIAIMIGRRGTVGHPVMRAALDATHARVETAFREAFVAVLMKVFKR